MRQPYSKPYNSVALDSLLNALGYEGRRPMRRYMCHCPAHDDRRPSLSVSVTADGKIFMHCFAGCPTPAILASIGFSRTDLFSRTHHSSQLTFPFYQAICATPLRQAGVKPATVRDAYESLGKIVARYLYRDAAGNPLCQVARFEPKTFRSMHYVNGRWHWGLGSVRPPLYRLPELLAAARDEWVFVVEGEKDVEMLRSQGLVATCNIGGAGKWKPEYGQWLAERRVCVLPDNDDAGRRHAEEVATRLTGVACQVQILEMAGLPEKGDVSDWLAMGGNGDELLALLNQAITPRFDCG